VKYRDDLGFNHTVDDDAPLGEGADGVTQGGVAYVHRGVPGAQPQHRGASGPGRPQRQRSELVGREGPFLSQRSGHALVSPPRPMTAGETQ
jgi:hypothetical protein